MNTSAADRQIAINAYTEQAQTLREIALIKQSRSWKVSSPYRWFARKLRGEATRPELSRYEGKDLSSSYYQNLHDTLEAYQQNNWLIDRIDDALRCEPESILEIGCGNGRFSKAVASRVASVVASDWAKSPMLTDLPANVQFAQKDIVNDSLPSCDLVCSADVLEHFHPTDINNVIEKLHQAGRYNYHVIACYDDNHSHLTIISPGQWLSLFYRLSAGYRIKSIEPRRNDPAQLICVIANF